MNDIENLQAQVIRLVESTSYIEKSKITSANHGVNTTSKQGLYFLYEDDSEPVYIGKIGNYKSTSLYSRLIGHGSGSHKEEFWYSKINKCKFYRFDGLDDKQLFQIERLVISKKTPKYNDTKINETEAKIILTTFPPCKCL